MSENTMDEKRPDIEDVSVSTEEQNDKKPAGKGKRIAAMIGAVILILMYLLLLVFAIIDVAGWQRFFFACLGATIIIPALLWINIYLYDRMMDRRKE